MSEPPYGWEGDELYRAASRIVKRLPETLLEVELEEVKQELDAFKAENVRLKSLLLEAKNCKLEIGVTCIWIAVTTEWYRSVNDLEKKP